MAQYSLNRQVDEDFTVVGPLLTPVSGIPIGEFSVELYDPTGTEVSGTVIVTLSELGGGSYRASFTPTSVGQWYINVFHATYFPWGKSNDVFVDDLDITDMLELMKKAWWNKKELIKNSDTQYTEKLYDDDKATVIRTHVITKTGNTETRNPV